MPGTLIMPEGAASGGPAPATLLIQGSATIATRGRGTRPAAGDDTLAEAQRAVEQLRTSGSSPDDLSDQSLQQLFSANNARFPAQADQVDPVAIAAELPGGLPTLLVCGRSDTQVPCDTLTGLHRALEERPGDTARSPSSRE